jgi:uncharacterized protein (DUF1501 family)
MPKAIIMRSSRREFLEDALRASAVLSIGAATPGFLLKAAAAAESAAKDDSILVVVQLSGGNDGLNTVVPFADDVYRKRRPKLALPEAQVLKISDRIGLHPSLTGFRDLFDRGELGIVQGVGYPDPNRSHFESMDIWHTCHRKEDRRPEGWLGRYLDASIKDSGQDVAALHLGREAQPLALAGRRVRVPSVTSLDRFRLSANDPALEKAVGEMAAAERKSDDLLGFVGTSAVGALAASREVERARGSYTASSEYPDTGLASKLKTVAQLIDAGLGTRVFYVTLDGFDTHSQQADVHALLLGELSGAVNAFLRDLDGHGHASRVLVMCFSEFGRRVEENASAGTDHGAAAPMFLAGKKVKAGLIGEHPSMTDLENGDLKFHTDFRTVYAAVLEQWLKWPAKDVLGAEWKPADVLAR